MTPRRNTSLLVVHCSDTKPSMDHVDAALINKWHIEDNGWSAIGYHYVIKRDGMLEKGRDEHVRGAHAREVNHSSVGICLVGGMAESGGPEANFTDGQYETLQELLTDLCARYPGVSVVGHRDVDSAGKKCPCFDVSAWWAAHSNGLPARTAPYWRSDAWLHIRQGPGKGNAPLRESPLAPGDVVTAANLDSYSSDNWTQVRVVQSRNGRLKGAVGWVNASYISALH